MSQVARTVVAIGMWCMGLGAVVAAGQIADENPAVVQGWQQAQFLSTQGHYARLTYNFARCLAVDDQHGVHTVWVAMEGGNAHVSYRRSLDGGRTWQEEVLLSAPSIPTPEDPHLPTIAVAGTHVYVAWHEVIDGKPAIMFRRSSDRGATWEEAQHVSHSPKGAAHASLAAFGSTVHLVWGDHRDGEHAEIYYARSSDEGATWSSAVRLTDLPFDSWVPSLTTTADTVYLAWVDTRDGNEEEYVKISRDGGVTWGPDTRLTEQPANSWAPSIAVEGNTVHVVWFDQQDAPAQPREAEQLLDEAMRLVGLPIEPEPTGVMVPHPEGVARQHAEQKVRQIQAAMPAWLQRGGNPMALQAIMHQVEEMGRPKVAEAMQQLDRVEALLGMPSARVADASPADLSMLRLTVERRIKAIQAAAPAWVGRGGDPKQLDTMMQTFQRFMTPASYAEKGRKLDEALQLLGVTVVEQPLGELLRVHYGEALSFRVQQKMQQIRVAAPAWVQHGGDPQRLGTLLQRVEQTMQLANSEWEIYYRRSVDGGKTWESATRLTHAPGPSQRPSIAVRDHRVSVVWFDGRDGHLEVYAKSSTDGGTTWTADERLTQTLGDLLYPAVALTSDATHVIWTDTSEGRSRISYIRASFSPAHSSSKRHHRRGLVGRKS